MKYDRPDKSEQGPFDGTAATGDVGRAARAGLGWLAGGRLVTQAIQFGGSIVLARLLVPDDFGLLAMAVAVGGLAKAVGDFGVSALVVQRKDLDQRFLNAAFTVNLVFFLAIGLVQVLIAPLGAFLMHEQRIIAVMIALAAVLPIEASASFHQAVLRRGLRFSRVTFVSLVRVATSALIACTLAVWGLGVWSLVAGAVGSAAVGSALVRRFSGVRSAFSFEAARAHFREILRFGRFSTGNSLINYLANSADYLVVGRLLSTVQLGYYYFAYEKSRIFSVQILGLVSSVAFPAFSRFQSSTERLRAAYLRVTVASFSIIAPATIFLAVNANELIPLIFGGQWGASIPILQILAIPVVFNAATSGGGSVVYAVGSPETSFRVMRWTIGPLLMAYYFGAVLGGLLGVAVAVAVAKSVNSCLFIFAVFRRMNWHPWPILRPLFKVLFGVLVSAACSRLGVVALSGLHAWAAIAVGATLFGGIYMVSQIILNREGLRLLWEAVLSGSWVAWCKQRIPQGVRRLLALPV